MHGAPSALASDLGGVFPTAAVRAELMAMYDAKLGNWPVAYEEADVPTQYGTAHVVVAGRADAPPVILVHMAASSSFIWAPLIAELAKHRRAYAIDIIGDVNKSVLANPDHYPRSGEALAGWLSEVADALRLSQTDVIAGSYGGWLAAHYALRDPKRVRRLVLIVPMGLPSWTQTLRVLARLATIQIGLSGSKSERTLSYLLGNDPAARALGGDWFSRLFEAKCRMRAASPRPLTTRQFEGISAPTLIVLGARDPLVGNPKRAARRATGHMPNVEIEIVPNGTHAVHIEAPERVAGRALEFLSRPRESSWS